MESYFQENYYRCFICVLQKIIKKVYSMEPDSISNHINIYNTLNTDPHFLFPCINSRISPKSAGMH